MSPRMSVRSGLAGRRTSQLYSVPSQAIFPWTKEANRKKKNSKKQQNKRKRKTKQDETHTEKLATRNTTNQKKTQNKTGWKTNRKKKTTHMHAIGTSHFFYSERS